MADLAAAVVVESHLAAITEAVEEAAHLLILEEAVVVNHRARKVEEDHQKVMAVMEAEAMVVENHLEAEATEASHQVVIQAAARRQARPLEAFLQPVLPPQVIPREAYLHPAFLLACHATEIVARPQ